MIGHFVVLPLEELRPAHGMIEQQRTSVSRAPLGRGVSSALLLGDGIRLVGEECRAFPRLVSRRIRKTDQVME